MLSAWQERVRVLKREITAVGYAARDPRTPWAARLVVLAIVAYAVSPIDLIPDFIPVLGLLDELLLLPAALALAIRLIPAEAMADARVRAEGQRLAPSLAAAVVIAAIWLAAAGYLAWLWWGASRV